MSADDAEFFDSEPWQHGFWTGYKLGLVRGRLLAWKLYTRRLLARTADQKNAAAEDGDR